MILNFARVPAKISPFDKNNKLKSNSKKNHSLNASKDNKNSIMNSSLHSMDNFGSTTNILSHKAIGNNIAHRLTAHTGAIIKKSFLCCHSEL